ncbi:PREDICTED: mucin-3A [Chrysochloris asiatica]|uniref:Mucin-3A n=1 Tax=Chrysochloris asiatica TaxID=185453 RepID=A0A9B0T7E3_CHRAS|nr:PREDICTED: mucin-3A [Chrysochloris asiatica]
MVREQRTVVNGWPDRARPSGTFYKHDHCNTYSSQILTNGYHCATSLSSTSIRTFLPTHMETSTSMPLETYSTGRPPSSIVTRTTPTNSVVTSMHGSTSGSWMSTNSVTTPHSPGVTNLPLTTKSTISFPSDTMTSSKLTQSTLPINKTSETPVTTTQMPTTHTSPTTTSTTTQSSVITTPGTCNNGGTWDNGQCLCPPGFSGDRCQLQDIKCQNGGRWDGLKCLCPDTFYGSLCEVPKEQVDLETVTAEVGMEVSVEQEFTSDLNDSTSQAYRDFNTTFQKQIKRIYQNVPSFKGVEILALRNGSIVVDYVVLLELPFSVQLESEYEKVKTTLKEQLQNASQEETDCTNDQALCFKPDSIKVNNNSQPDLTPEALCRSIVAKDYQDFYFPLIEGNKLRCVTKCMSDVQGALDCHQGQCLLEKSGPVCRCFSSNTHWFTGPRCEVAVHWRALVGGLSGAVLLLLGLLVSGIFVVRWQRVRSSRDRSWTDDGTWSETWDKDIVGTFSNLGFQDDKIVENKNFEIALENVDTNMVVHIQRPEVSSSLI